MLLSKLRRQPTQAGTTAPDLSAPVTPVKAASAVDLNAAGVPLTSPNELLAKHQAEVEALMHALRLEGGAAQALVIPLLKRYARFVHRLPASEHHHHAYLGGLLQHGIEAARHAAEAAGDRVFLPDSTPTVRRLGEPRWRFCAAMGALLHDLGKTISDLRVVSVDGLETWIPFQRGLYDWARGLDLQGYRIEWRARRHRQHEAFAGSIAPRFLDDDLLAWLSRATDPWVPEHHSLPVLERPGLEPLEAMMGHLLGARESALTPVIRYGDTISCEQNLSRERSAALSIADAAQFRPAERFLVQLKRMLTDGLMSINQAPTGAAGGLLVTERGYALDMEHGLGAVLEMMRKDVGVLAPKTLLTDLSHAGYLVYRPKGDWTWTVEATFSQGQAQVPVQMRVICFSKSAKLHVKTDPLPIRWLDEEMEDSDSEAVSSASEDQLLLFPVQDNEAPTAPTPEKPAARKASTKEPTTADAPPSPPEPPSPPAPTAAGEATPDLDGRGAVYLKALVSALSGLPEADRDQLAEAREGIWRMRYPDILERAELGTAHERIARAFQDARYLQPNPTNPSMFTTRAVFRGSNMVVLQFTAAASKLIDELFDETPPATSPPAPQREEQAAGVAPIQPSAPVSDPAQPPEGGVKPARRKKSKRGRPPNRPPALSEEGMQIRQEAAALILQLAGQSLSASEIHHQTREHLVANGFSKMAINVALRFEPALFNGEVPQIHTARTMIST